MLHLSVVLHKKDLSDSDNFIKLFYLIFIKMYALLELKALFLLKSIHDDLADEITEAFVSVGEA